MHTAEKTVSQQLKTGDWMFLGYHHCKRSPYLGHIDPVVEQLWGRMKKHGDDAKPLDLQAKRFLTSAKAIVPATEVPRYRIGELFRAGEGGGIIGSVRSTVYRFNAIDVSNAQTLRGYQCRDLVQHDIYPGFRELPGSFFTVVKGCTDKEGCRATLVFPSSVIFCAFYTSSHNLVAALFRDRLANDGYNEFWDPDKSHWVKEKEDTYFVRLERGMKDYDFWLIAHFAVNSSYWKGAQSSARSLHGNMAKGAPILTLFPCQSVPNLKTKCIEVGTHDDEPVLLVIDILDYDLSSTFPKPIRHVEYERDNPGGDGSNGKSHGISETIKSQKLQGSEHNFSPSVDAAADNDRIPSDILDQDYACAFARLNQNRGIKLEQKTKPDNKQGAYVSDAEKLEESSLDTGGQNEGAHPLRIITKKVSDKIACPNLELLGAAIKLLANRGVTYYWLPDGTETRGYNLEQRLGSYHNFQKNKDDFGKWLRVNKRVLQTTRKVYVCELTVDGVTSYLFEIEQRTASESFCAFLCPNTDHRQSDQLVDLVLLRITTACGVASKIDLNAAGPSIYPLKHINHLADRIEQIIRPDGKASPEIDE